jgi:hypothetical protein
MPSLPLSTTSLVVRRRSQTGDPYEAPGVETDLATVRGVVYTPSGRESILGGAQEITDARAILPAGTDVTHLDVIYDSGTGVTWAVQWASAKQGLGLDHVVCGVNRVQGQVA